MVSIWLDENANIIIFMTHHSKDQRLIDEILLNTMMRFSDTQESTLGPDETGHFLEYEKMIPELVIEERNFYEERLKRAQVKDELDDRLQGTSIYADFGGSVRD